MYFLYTIERRANQYYSIHTNPYYIVEANVKDINITSQRFYQIGINHRPECYGFGFGIPESYILYKQVLDGEYWFSILQNDIIWGKQRVTIKLYFKDGILQTRTHNIPILCIKNFCDSNVRQIMYRSGVQVAYHEKTLKWYYLSNYLEFCKLTEIGCNHKWNTARDVKPGRRRKPPPAFTSNNLWEPKLAKEIFSYLEIEDCIKNTP